MAAILPPPPPSSSSSSSSFYFYKKKDSILSHILGWFFFFNKLWVCQALRRLGFSISSKIKIIHFMIYIKFYKLNSCMLQHGECGVTVFKILYTQLYVTKTKFWL
jgi:hypothetical protein